MAAIHFAYIGFAPLKLCIFPPLIHQKRALNLSSLSLVFENGEHRRFDMANYIYQKTWVRLKTGHAFQGAFIENSTVTWPGNIDIDPETLYEYSAPLGCVATKTIRTCGADILLP
jgi:hypothetical protein